MKLLMWNIRQGGGSRLVTILNEIKKHNADIIVLTEYRDNEKSKVIKERLRNQDYIYQFYNPNLKNIKEMKEKLIAINSVFICSKIPLNNCSEVYIENNEERVIVVECNGIKIYPMYFPQKNGKREVFNFIMDKIEDDKENISLFIGDFNTGDNLLDRENQKSAKFYCEKEFRDIDKKGYSDIWRNKNGDSREYTWYSSKSGFRIDHAFISKKHLDIIKDCYYIHEAREKKISDHSIMIIEFNNEIIRV